MNQHQVAHADLVTPPALREKAEMLGGNIATNSELLRVDDCNRLMSDSADTATCTPEHAEKLLLLMAAAYPQKDNRDNFQFDTWATLIRRELMRASPADAEAAIESVLRKCRFLPSFAEISDAISEQSTRRRKCAVIAKKHLAEHKRRAQDFERDNQGRNSESDAFCVMAAAAQMGWAKVIAMPPDEYQKILNAQ